MSHSFIWWRKQETNFDLICFDLQHPLKGEEEEEKKKKKKEEEDQKAQATNNPWQRAQDTPTVTSSDSPPNNGNDGDVVVETPGFVRQQTMMNPGGRRAAAPGFIRQASIISLDKSAPPAFISNKGKSASFAGSFKFAKFATLDIQGEDDLYVHVYMFIPKSIKEASMVCFDRVDPNQCLALGFRVQG